MADWTRSDSAAAMAEGWDVWAIDGKADRLAIQRHDEAETFASDDDAISFVRQRAVEGSELHLHALRTVS